MLVLSWTSKGVGVFATGTDTKDRVLYGWMILAEALLQTVGAILIAASDIDLDLFVKRHQIYVLVFALAWISLNEGLVAMVPPIQAMNQAIWLSTVPFAYLLLHFKSVLEMRSENYPRFADLFAYSLSFDIMGAGLMHFIHANSSGTKSQLRWPENLNGCIHFFSGLFLLFFYRHRCSKSSRRVAFAVTLYAYLLLNGVCSLVNITFIRAGRQRNITFIDYSYAIIHITFPLGFFAFRPCINPFLGRHWLRRRSCDPLIVAEEQHIAAHQGNLHAVKEVLGADGDLNAYLDHGYNEGDRFTLLTLACFNQHEDSVNLLLDHPDVQVNKGSCVQHWTPLHVAAMQGHISIVQQLIACGANVHARTEDDQSALLAATAHGHEQVAKALMEAGASRKHSAWMGIDAADAATTLGREGVVKALRAYQSHFQGNILEVDGCACVASWPGIYCKSWCV
jgi:hypothetical protein